MYVYITHVGCWKDVSLEFTVHGTPNVGRLLHTNRMNGDKPQIPRGCFVCEEDSSVCMCTRMLALHFPKGRLV